MTGDRMAAPSSTGRAPDDGSGAEGSAPDHLGATLAVLLDEDAPSEERARLTDRAVAALRGSGSLRAGVPDRWGGEVLRPAAVLDRVGVLATASGAAAWVAALAYGSNLAGAMLPERGQRDLWRTDPDGHGCGSFSPSGTARWTGDGYVVDAVVEPISGIHSAGWLMVMVLETGGTGRGPLLAFVPIAAVRVERTWDAMGLRGSGSDRGVLVGVPVPAHRVLPVAAFAAGMAAIGLPVGLFGPMLLAVPLVGLARGAVELAETTLRGTAGSPPARAARPDVLAAYGELAMAVDRADGLLGAARAAVAAGAEALDERAERRAVTLTIAAVQEAARAADLLPEVLGADALQRSSRANRIWRDVRTGASHTLFRTAPVREGHAADIAGA